MEGLTYNGPWKHFSVLFCVFNDKCACETLCKENNIFQSNQIIFNHSLVSVSYSVFVTFEYILLTFLLRMLLE